MGKCIDMTGWVMKEHGVQDSRLTVVSRSNNVGSGRKVKAVWLCRCECGNMIEIRADAIRFTTLSCGCLQKEVASKNVVSAHNHSKTHGDSKSRLYRIWTSMKTRCYNSNHEAYNLYGGRGITVCDEWRDNYIEFEHWAVNNGYAPNLTIDRIDVDGGYYPDNCRWATPKEQSNNKSNNHAIIVDGICHNVTEWANISGVNRETIYWRIKHGWDAHDAVYKKPRGWLATAIDRL